MKTHYFSLDSCYAPSVNNGTFEFHFRDGFGLVETWFIQGGRRIQIFNNPITPEKLRKLANELEVLQIESVNKPTEPMPPNYDNDDYDAGEWHRPM